MSQQVGLPEVIKALGSKKFSVIIMGILTLFTMVRFLPQQLKGNHGSIIFASDDWVSRICFLAFCANLLLGLYQNWFKDMFKAETRQNLNSRHVIQHHFSKPFVGDKIEFTGKLSQYFKKRAYKVRVGNNQSLVACRGRWSYLGSLLFHISIGLIIAGFAISTYYGFYVNTTVTEGDTFSLLDSTDASTNGYGTPQNFSGRLPDLKFKLVALKPKFLKNNDTFTDLDTELIYFKNGQEDYHKIPLNSPFIEKGNLLILEGIGYAPFYYIENSSGQVIEKNAVQLSNFPSGINESFNLSGLPFEVNMIVFPDCTLKNGKPATKTNYLVNPKMMIHIFQNKKLVYKGLLGIGEKAKFDKYTISFPEIRYCGDFKIISDYGAWIALTGMVLAFFTLVWKLINSYREYSFTFEETGGGTIINGEVKGEYFNTLWKNEINKIMNKGEFS